MKDLMINRSRKAKRSTYTTIYEIAKELTAE